MPEKERRGMIAILKNRYVLALAFGAVVSGVINSGFIVANSCAVAPHGSETDLWPALVLIFPLVGALLALPFALLLAVPRRIRKPALQTTVFLAVYVVVGLAALHVGETVRRRGFEALAARSTPLVAAIKRYAADHGNPPAQLTDLVPEYLPAVPSTGMDAYPEYQYLVGEAAKQYEGNPWVLVVNTPSGGINFDRFVYFPKGNYPDHAYSSWLEPIGDWAYCHE